MKFVQTSIPDVVLIEPAVFEDARGWFMESFNQVRFDDGLRNLGVAVPTTWVQDNHSCSRKGTLRGLHYQIEPFAQGKLVRVVQGAAFDVAVDIRRGSPTFGQWVGAELSAENHRMLWIPAGFAHGFVALEDNTHFLYKTTGRYSKAHERSIRWDDPELNIEWPEHELELISQSDREAPLFSAAQLPSPCSVSAEFSPISFRTIGDHRGSLVAVEQSRQIPFEIKRLYYIFNTQAGVSRGFHAHRSLQQVLVCVSGSCRLALDDGSRKVEYQLDNPAEGLFVKGMVWREMHDFSPDCVLLVMASEFYEEDDYIRDYDHFLSEVKRGQE